MATDQPATAASGTGADHDCGDAGECPIHDALTPATKFVGGRVEHCGACLGTGTVADHCPDGSFDPVDCDACHGWGYTRVDSKGRHRDPMGRFCG